MAFHMAIVLPILFLILTAIAIYVQVTSSALSLPLSMGTTILTILLPLIAAANIFYTPILDRLLLRASHSPAIQRLVPPALQILQFALTVVLATLTSEGFIPGQNLDCNLEGNWQRLWHNHDGRAIERIQDSFSCCGLRSVKDRAWPPNHCQDFYNRHSSCVGPWRASMQSNAGLGFGVAVIIGIVQAISLAVSRLRNPQEGSARGLYKRIASSHGSRPSDRLVEDRGVEEDEADEEPDTPAQRGYGALEDGTAPRVQPSGLGTEENQWRS